jgi:hypothetical protein
VADEPDQRGEHRPEQEEQRPPDPGAPAALGDRQGQQQQEDDDGEDGEGPELTAQVRGGALLHRSRDVTHGRRALVRREHVADQDEGERQCAESDDEGDRRQDDIAAGQCAVGHVCSSLRSAAAAGWNARGRGARRAPGIPGARTSRDCKGDHTL